MDSMTAFPVLPLLSLPSLGDVIGRLPIENPTWVFFIVLAIILLAPMVLTRLHIPHVVGMILAGVAVGPHGLNLLDRDESFRLFGQVGIYYIMFLAGLEMDLAGLKQNRRQGLVFGAFTALIPFLMGFVAAVWLLDYSLPASLLLACIFASHTLVAYPIVTRYGLSRDRSVVVSVAATMVALLLSLLILAALSGTVRGEAGWMFWLLFVVKFGIFLVVLFMVFPRVIRWFFRKYSEPVMQFIFVLGMVFLAAATAEACGLEGILGAFLAGLVFTRFVPRSTPLMNRLEFVGNALFIPYFLIGVGMLVNLEPLFTDPAALVVVAVMVVVGTLSKYIAAVVSRHIFGMTRADGLMMFGLSEAHAAGALAMVMVGTALTVEPGVPLMDNAVLDGVVVMILISCIISSVATDQSARMLKLQGEQQVSVGKQRQANDDEKILVPINEPDKIEMLVQTAILMRNAELNRGLICLNIVNDDDSTGVLRRHSKDCLLKAERICASADVKVQTQSRLAVNFINGVIHAFHENDASEIVIGLHRKRTPDDSLLGRFAQGLIDGLDRQIIIVNFLMPANTFRKIVVAVPERAQFESGFHRWVERVARLALETGCRIEFNATEETAGAIRAYLNYFHPLVRDEYAPYSDGISLEALSKDVRDDYLFVLVMARHGTISYERRMGKMQHEVGKHFSGKSLMIVYPEQRGDAAEMQLFGEPHIHPVARQSRINQWLSKWISKIG